MLHPASTRVRATAVPPLWTRSGDVSMSIVISILYCCSLHEPPCCWSNAKQTVSFAFAEYSFIMRFLQHLSLFFSLTSVAWAQTTTSSASCPAVQCTPGAQASIASSLNGYAPASSLCSASYVTIQTCGAAVPTSTISTIVSTVTTQVVAQTASVT